MADCRRIVAGLTLSLLMAAAAMPAPAAAQAEPKALGTFDSWTAIEIPAKSGKVCYMVAKPARSEPENVRRGDILLTVTHRPAAKGHDEVSFRAGYPYKPGAAAVVEVGNKKFELFTKQDVDPDGAWSRDSAMDKELVEAMRAGLTLTIKGTSARGTETTDTFSLQGFTKALAEIDKACGVR